MTLVELKICHYMSKGEKSTKQINWCRTLEELELVSFQSVVFPVTFFTHYSSFKLRQTAIYSSVCGQGSSLT